MGNRYAYVGHAGIGDYVRDRLGQNGWELVDDIVDADVVVTYCMGHSALEDAYFESEGIVKLACPGTLLVDLSASTPSLSREWSAIATVNDLRPVEAPLVFEEPFADAATIDVSAVSCYVAGEDEDVDAAISLIEALAGTVERTGGCGTAQLAKTVRTIQDAAQIMAAIESDALVRATKAAATSVGRLDGHTRPAAPLAKSALDAIDEGRYAGAYTVELLMGEVAAAMTAADDVDLILPQIEAAMHLLEILAVIGGADKGPAALSLVYRDEASSAAAGLDWTRAERLFQTEDNDSVEYGDADEYGFNEDDLGGYAGGFGGYFAN